MHCILVQVRCKIKQLFMLILCYIDTCRNFITFRLYYKHFSQSLFIYVMFISSFLAFISSIFMGINRVKYQIPQQSALTDWGRDSVSFTNSKDHEYSSVLADIAQPLNPIQWGSFFSNFEIQTSTLLESVCNELIFTH